MAAPINRPELAQRPVFEEELVLLTGHLHAPVLSPHDVARHPARAALATAYGL